jgi:hypothetical protein
LISYEIIKTKPVISVPTHGTPYYQQPRNHLGLFERRRIEREKVQGSIITTEVAAPTFDLRPFSNVDVRMPNTDELVTELVTKGEFKANPPNTPHPIGMGKQQYAEWLNQFVYPSFKKNMLVTFKTIPIVLNEVPKVFFLVLDIQQMHYWVQMDKETREPKVVGIALPGNTVPCYYPPSVMRPLVPSEVEAIDKLRNQTSQGRVLEADGGDGATVIDRSTGEILSSD